VNTFAYFSFLSANDMQNFFNYHSLTHRNDSKAGTSRSRRSRGLRRGYGAARLLELRVRIPLWNMDMYLFVSVVCCQVEVSATADHTPRGLLPNVVCLSVIVKPQHCGGPGSLGTVQP
jgi:hypothetical protein